MISQKQMLNIISEKVDKLEKLYDVASRKEGYSGHDIHLLLRFTLSLERQIRQLRTDLEYVNRKVLEKKP